MENRFPSVLAGLIALWAIPFVAVAAEVGPAAEQQARLDKATAMQAASKKQQAEAEKLLDEKNVACATRFLVNDCRNAAYKEYVTSIRAARRMENDGKTMEREVKREQLSERDKQRVADAPRRAADLREREIEAAKTHRMAEEKMAASREGKARKAAAGEQRKTADAEKFRQKQVAHDARVAKKMQEAEQRAAKAAAKK